MQCKTHKRYHSEANTDHYMSENNIEVARNFANISFACIVFIMQCPSKCVAATVENWKST